MNKGLTEQEQAIIDKIRRREQEWPRTKWVLLIGSIFISVSYILFLLWTYQEIAANVQTLDAMSVLVFVLPKIIFALTLSALGVWVAIRDWSGNATRKLLIKLVDHTKSGLDTVD